MPRTFAQSQRPLERTRWPASSSLSRMTVHASAVMGSLEGLGALRRDGVVGTGKTEGSVLPVSSALVLYMLFLPILCFFV